MDTLSGVGNDREIVDLGEWLGLTIQCGLHVYTSLGNGPQVSDALGAT